ncbi:MAG TPA: hypothetical protein VJT31_04995 [Rugosimonospora sp.]|nr:hypothetical protein [Rugosimonospora sp.]
MTPTSSEAVPLEATGRRLLFTEAHPVKRFSPTAIGDAELAGIWDLAK